MSALELNHDLGVISQWATQWKTSFNPDPTKPAEEILFFRKRTAVDHHPLYLYGIEVKSVPEHKHLGLVLVLFLIPVWILQFTRKKKV